MSLNEWLERKGLGDASIRLKAGALALPTTTTWRLLQGKSPPDLFTIAHVQRVTRGRVKFEDWLREAEEARQ
jgi:hypothetical protein